MDSKGPIGTPGGTADQPALFFADAAEFRSWLEGNHETAAELWMGLRGAHVPDRGLTWAQAVPQALCFGWIDSVSQRIDGDSRRQRWTPRRPGSIWSRVNLAHVERLQADGLMRPAGIAAYEARRRDRSGVYSYEIGAGLTSEQQAALTADLAASAFWEEAPASYRKAVAAWLNTAVRERTRTDRLAALIADCAAGRLIKPQRYGHPPRWLARAAAAAAQQGGGLG